jgi:ribonuclease HI
VETHTNSLNEDFDCEFALRICSIENEVAKINSYKPVQKSNEAKKESNTVVQRGAHRHKLFFDGSACPLLRNGGFGFSIQVNHFEVSCLGGLMGNATVNDAELFALYAGLKRARELNIDAISVLGDSKLVVKLGTKGAVCFNSKFIYIFLEIQRLISEFKFYDIHYIPRAHNSRADVLAYTACNAPDQLQFVMDNPACNRPSRSVSRPHTYVVPKVNTSSIWHHRIWNPIPQKNTLHLDVNKTRTYMNSLLRIYYDNNGLRHTS